jgi:GTP-binding protein Era
MFPAAKEIPVPDTPIPHDASDELPEDFDPETGADDDTVEDAFAEDGEMIETPLSEAAMAAMLSASVDENGQKKRCGLVAIVGRPNVGKSTLLNALVGQKISITSNKAQTTRHRITGVRSEGAAQFVFVDTPGYQTKHSAALNKSLNKTVVSVLTDVDLVLFMVEAGKFGSDDAKALQLMPKGKPVILIPNKLDTVHRRSDLLPWLQKMQGEFSFAEFFPMSAYSTNDIARLLAVLDRYLPEQPWFYEPDTLTDRSERFLVSEVIREKLFRLTGDELPYNVTVVIDQFAEEGTLRRIAATIIVERDAHKGMVIGAKGAQLKRIASESRQELERLLEAKVFLEVWVKVRSGWADSEEHLRSYGYE